MPQVGLDGHQHCRHGQNDYGLDGAADFEASTHDDGLARQQATWPASTSSGANNRVHLNGAYIPARSHWPQANHVTAQNNPVLRSHPRQQHDRETVRVFLDPSPTQAGGGGDAQTTQHSSVTNWGDIYTGGRGWL
jgi:hypothetical protein